MGSTFDEPHAKKITDKLDDYGISWEQHAASAHKQPLKVLEILKNYPCTKKWNFQKLSKNKNLELEWIESFPKIFVKRIRTRAN